MTQSQIRYFLAVAQEMSFSKAAEALFVSQPAVSRQVSLLEQELGFPLFDRTTQGITITDAGKAFQAFFLESQRQFHALKETHRAGNDTLRGNVSIGCTEGWDLSEFYQHITAFTAEKYPRLRLILSGFNHDRILSALYHGEADVIITTESLLRGRRDLSSARLTTRQAILLFSAHHPLAGKPGLSLSDFRDEPFYCTAPPAMKECTLDILSLCGEAGFVPTIEYIPTLSATYMKLSSGRGVLLCNDWMMSRNNPLFSFLPLDARRQVSLAWLTENKSPAVHLFINEILFYFRRRDAEESKKLYSQADNAEWAKIFSPDKAI